MLTAELARAYARVERARAEAAAAEWEAIAAELSADRRDWIDQAGSPLGRKHCQIVRRRLEAGLDGATRIGRRHLLSRAALNEELARLGRPAPAPSEEEPSDYGQRMHGALRALDGGRR